MFVDFSKAFDSIHRGEMEQIFLSYGLPKETVAAIIVTQPFTRPLDVWPYQVGDQISTEPVVYSRWEFLDPDNRIQCVRWKSK